MGRLREPKIDCHVHIFDPDRFPYVGYARYKPQGGEIATATHLDSVLDFHGVGYALIVGPNSGYDTDNRCLIDTLRRSGGRYKGVAVVENNISFDDLAELKGAGIVGVAFNLAFEGVEHYRNSCELIEALGALNMYLQLQFEGAQVAEVLSLVKQNGPKLIIDHCGRPDIGAGVDHRAFGQLLELGQTGIANIKLSGLAKFSRQSFPYDDTQPYVERLIRAYSLDRCMWGSDWPFIRAKERIDYGPTLSLLEHVLIDPADRKRVLFDTPMRLFGFG
jgi:predicted TIM-barrel fold metal-dependent hydrolase